MTYRRQSEFLETHRRSGAPLVLATVYETAGSTYSKAGARMLIDAEGRFQGMLSGGCLEGDLAMRARVALDSRSVQYAAYDLGGDNDELWGMGVGCDGRMRVLLQPLVPATGFEPAAALFELAAGRLPLDVLTCVESRDPAIPPGTTSVQAGDVLRGTPAAAALRAAVMRAHTAAGLPRLVSLDGGALSVLVETRPPETRLLVLGAGLDAEPLVRFAAELGWRSTVCDHRPAYVAANDFAPADARHCVPADELAATLPLDDYDMAVVMSHHLASDRTYLRQLAGTRIPYIGLLGPPGRRERLLRDLGEDGKGLTGRLHGPAGLDLGGRGPAAIALSIVAQMQQHLAAATRVAR
ncbi:MAG TPA: XdhC family protein [Woeseiaceae bacterium]|nr:XdhC family protein [Woeseiaceae bacterium]